MIVDVDCSTSTESLYGGCLGAPVLVTGGASVKFPFTDVPQQGIGLGPAQGSGQQTSLWFLTGVSLDANNTNGSPLGTDTATLMLGTSGGTALQIATIGLVPASSNGCDACIKVAGGYVPYVESFGQGMVFTSEESDGLHLLYADVSQAVPAISDLGLLASTKKPYINLSSFPFYFAPDGKHVWFRNGSGVMVVGPTSANCGSACTADVEANVPGGIDDSDFFLFSPDGSAAAFVDSNGCNIPLTNGDGSDAGIDQPDNCGAIWTAASDGTNLHIIVPYSMVGNAGALPDPSTGGQIVGSPGYGTGNSGNDFLQVEVFPFVAGAQTPHVLASSEAYGGKISDTTVAGSTLYVAIPNSSTGWTTILAGDPTQAAPFTKITDNAIDWLISSDGTAIVHRDSTVNNNRSAPAHVRPDFNAHPRLYVAQQSSDGGVGESLIESDNVSQITALTLAGRSDYANQQSSSQGQALVHGSLIQATQWNTPVAAVSYVVGDGSGDQLLRYSTLDATTQSTVAVDDAGVGFEYAALSPDGYEIIWSTDGGDFNVGVTQPAAPYLAALDENATLIPGGAQDQVQSFGFIADDRLLVQIYEAQANNNNGLSLAAAVSVSSSSMVPTLLTAYNDFIAVSPSGRGAFFDGVPSESGTVVNAYRLVSGASSLELVAYNSNGQAISPDGERMLASGFAAGPAMPAGDASGPLLLIGAGAAGPPAMTLLDHLGQQGSKKDVAGRSVRHANAVMHPDASARNMAAVSNGPYNSLDGAIWLQNSLYAGLRSGTPAPDDFQDGIYEGVVSW